MINKYLKILFIVFFVTSSFSSCSNISFKNIDNKTSESFNLIKLKKPTNRIEQIFNQSFRTKIITNKEFKPVYFLDYEIISSSSNTLSVKGRNSIFNNNEMKINYYLKNLSDYDIISKGIIKANALSGTISSYYTQEKSSQFATERLSKLLAQKVFQKLQIFFYEKSLNENKIK